MPPKITVAIATGRATEDTHYEKWMAVREAFLNRDLQSRHLNGEFGALLAAVLDDKADYHIEYQLRALDKGTRQPDRIIVVDRKRDDIGSAEYIDDLDNPGRGMVVEPMVSQRELELMPEAALGTCLSRRSNRISMGCNDKNTAIALCETEFLLMLDDCCLPGFGLVEAAYRACSKNRILLVGHQQMYLEQALEWSDTKIEVAQANWQGHDVYTAEEAKQLRRVFGVWAMPLSHILAVNGFNTDLDGDRADLDLELLERMDRYVKAQDLRYQTSHRSCIYEVGHEMPWKDESHRSADWREKLPDGWGFKAPGPSLKEIRKAAGICVGSDIFDLAGHADDVEQAEHLGEILEDALDPDDPDDE